MAEVAKGWKIAALEEPLSKYHLNAINKERNNAHRATKWSRSLSKHIYIRYISALLSHILAMDGVGLAVVEDEELLFKDKSLHCTHDVAIFRIYFAHLMLACVRHGRAVAADENRGTKGIILKLTHQTDTMTVMATTTALRAKEV